MEIQHWKRVRKKKRVRISVGEGGRQGVVEIQILDGGVWAGQHCYLECWRASYINIVHDISMKQSRAWMKGRMIQLYGCTPMFLKQFRMPQSFLCGTVVDQWALFVFTVTGELSQLTSIISSSNDGNGSILDLIYLFIIILGLWVIWTWSQVLAATEGIDHWPLYIWFLAGRNFLYRWYMYPWGISWYADMANMSLIWLYDHHDW